MSVLIQYEDFDVGAEMSAMRSKSNNVGAMVSFVGLVRDMSYQEHVENIYVEHYPGMSEKALLKILEVARQRWDNAQHIYFQLVPDNSYHAPDPQS